jgi:hypothetical protein
MQTITKYKAEDGALFDTAMDAERRDVLVRRCQEIDALLPSVDVGYNERFTHSPVALDHYRTALIELCRELYPDQEIFKHPAASIHPMSFAGRFLDDVAPQCVRVLWFRLACINDVFEYEQPYFALNPDKWTSKA